MIPLRMNLTRNQARFMLACLVKLNRSIIRRGSFKPLLQSGVRYRRESGTGEQWQTIDQLYRRGEGDCEDLATARCAQLQEQGVNCTVELLRTGRRLLHAVVKLPDGTIDDPSRALGM